MIVFFLFGLLFGSFANVVILRLNQKGKGVTEGRSECPKCHHVLGFFDLVPVISWIFLRGKCRYCREKISIQYPLVELAMGFLWILTFFFFPVGPHSGWLEWVRLGILLFTVSSLLIITVYDLKYLEIPDEVSLPTIAILLLALPFAILPSWEDALLGAAIPLAFFSLQILISQGKWMGGGDLRLAAIMGLLLGWQKTILALSLSYFTGAIIGVILLAFRKKGLRSEIPFGPFLALGTMVALFWGNEIIRWYLDISGISILLES